MLKRLELFKGFGSSSFLLGLGLAAFAYILGPTLKRGARTATVRGMQGAMMLGETAGNAVESGREKVSNVMQGMFSNSDQERFIQQILQEMKEERDQQQDLLQELVTTVKGMQEEIATLKDATRT